MKKSTTAVLFSAFIFPGAGQIFLHRYVTGAILGGTTLAALAVLVSAAIEKAQIIVDKILSGEIGADAVSIMESVVSQSGANESQLVNIATIVIVVCWLIGIADAYRVGRVPPA